jgi:putative ABC transport system ATP-binding protein
MVLNAMGLRKHFGAGDAAVAAVDGVSVSAAEGEFLAITGPSGSGKSTLLALLAGLERPTAGEVWLAGRCLAALDDAALARLRRREVGFVFQSFNLVPVLSVEENVALPFLLDGRPRREWGPRVTDALEAVELSHRRRHLPDQVSVGERQRAAIARALAVRPSVLFADEPTGSLDSQRGQAVLTLLRSAAVQGCAVVMVTHDLGAAALADRAIRICDGRVEAPSPAVVAAC